MAAMTNFRERQSWPMFLLIHLSSGPGSYKKRQTVLCLKADISGLRKNCGASLELSTWGSGCTT